MSTIGLDDQGYAVDIPPEGSGSDVVESTTIGVDDSVEGEVQFYAKPEAVRLIGDTLEWPTDSAQNNVNHVGFSDADGIRYEISTAVSFSGMAGGADGAMKFVANAESSTATLTLLDDSTSTAANRLDLNGADMELPPGGVVWFRYNGNTSRWHPASSHIRAAAMQIDEFNSSGTWTKPAGAKMVEVILVGAGGGGGGGARTASGNASSGGSGGGSAAAKHVFFKASSLGATETITLGTGGTGGTGATSDGNAGGNGSAGSSNSTFGTYLDAQPGGGGAGGQLGGNSGGGGGAGSRGAGGSATSATAGTAGSIGGVAGGSGAAAGNASVTGFPIQCGTGGGGGINGAAGNSAPGGNSYGGASGGGPGGGIATSPALTVGGPSGAQTYSSNDVTAANTNAATPAWYGPGCGGGGGSSNPAGAGNPGGNGARGGGGGGGGSAVGGNGGAGGSGGNAYCCVITHF